MLRSTTFWSFLCTVRTAFKFIMVAFEMSVGDSLCKTSTEVREGGWEESWDG